MLVFTKEWVKQIHDRYNHRPEGSRPFLYSVATDNECKPLRAEIEKFVANLPQSTQGKVISRLRSPYSFIQTYHELVVGDLLIRRDYDIEYEKTIKGLTPDWYVQPKDQIPSFIVEVFTDNISNARASKLRQVDDLHRRLNQIPIGVANDEDYEKKLILNQKLNKNIAKKVALWLTNGKPPAGAELSIEGTIFKVLHYNNQYSTLQFAGPPEAFWVNPTPLKENLEKKIKRYKDINIPLVICVFADFRTGYRFDDIQDVLLGERKTVTTKGLFDKYHILSATIWMDLMDIKTSKWEMKMLNNPNALLPLPSATFGI